MDWKQLIFTIIIGFINIICSKYPLLLCYKSEFLTHFEYGVKSAELHIKIKSGHFEHIMKIKPTIIVNINCFQSIFKNLMDSVHELLQKLHFQMGHPVLFHF